MAYCKWCGMKFHDVRTLVNNNCQRNPAGYIGHKHELYEGAEKKQYTCKYCGQTFRSIGDMSVIKTCRQSKVGDRRHEPAL
jgi:predicted Zn-ribbon and HTH transcriptional regulator